MNKRGGIQQMLGVLAQLLFAAALIALLFLFAESSLSGDIFRQDVYATDNAMLAETIQAATEGRVQAHTYFDHAAYKLQFTEERIGVTALDAEQSAVTKPYLRDANTEIREDEIVDVGVLWTWQEDIISISTTTKTKRCADADDYEFDEIVTIGTPELRQHLTRAAGNALLDTNLNIKTQDTIPTVEYLSQRQQAEFFLSIRRDSTRKGMRLYSGIGENNVRLRCQALRFLRPLNPVSYGTLEEATGLHIVIPEDFGDEELEQLEDGLEAALSAYKEQE